MIVETMTHTEVYDELAKERSSVTAWWRHRLLEQRSAALKRIKFPMHIWKEYTSKRNNRYVFFSRVFDRKMNKILTGVAVIVYKKEGLTVYTTWLGDQQLIAPMVLLPHVWKRYQDPERGNVQKSGTELVKHFFVNNPHGKDTDNKKVVGRSVRYNGEEHLSLCVSDGVLLGHICDDIFVANTFITYDMAKGLQRKEFENKRKEIMTDREMYDKMEAFYEP